MIKTDTITLKNISEREYFYGHKACGGCGGSIAIRLALKIVGEKSFALLPAGCMSAVSFVYPQMAFGCNAMITPFPGAASLASGVYQGLRMQNISDAPVIVFAGDGGTADIGLQALSGAIDRNEKIIYVCYDNEAYMNTGIQKSGLTPFGTKTTTTPIGKHSPGAVTNKKRIFEIIAAHGISYAATASIGYPLDYMQKIKKASRVEGTSFIHVFAPCPTGWGIDSDKCIECGREAVTCGLWYLAEYEGGKFNLNTTFTPFTSLSAYIKKQTRFKHLTDEHISCLEHYRDTQYERLYSYSNK